MESSKIPVDKLLAESFKELACRQQIDKITIKQITDKAGVTRPTFYRHFTDKYNLLEWILVQEILVPAQPLIANGMINEAMMLIFFNIEKEKNFYMHAARMEGQNSLNNMVETGIRALLSGMIKERMKDKELKNKWLTPDRLADYYSRSMAYIVMTWIQSGMEISPTELLEVYNFMITRSLADVLQDMDHS